MVLLTLLCRYEKAEEYFLLALQKMGCVSEQSVMAEKWEPLLNNLGHVCRKLRYAILSVYFVHKVATINNIYTPCPEKKETKMFSVISPTKLRQL